MADGNGVRCDKCGTVENFSKQLEIWKEPDVLVLHIKRFHFTGRTVEKLSTAVDVPIDAVLDL